MDKIGLFTSYFVNNICFSEFDCLLGELGGSLTWCWLATVPVLYEAVRWRRRRVWPVVGRGSVAATEGQTGVRVCVSVAVAQVKLKLHQLLLILQLQLTQRRRSHRHIRHYVRQVPIIVGRQATL